MTSAPMSPVGPTSFVQTWVDSLTKPREATYSSIAESPKAKATTGYLWVFVASIISSIVSLIAQGQTLRDSLSQTGVSPDQLGGGVGAIAITLLCGAPILAVLSTVFFAIGSALIQWIAKMFGGKGTNDQTAYVLAGVGAPASIVSSLFVLLSAIPYVGLCFSAVAGLFGIYVLVLEILAVKSVNRFGWGPAIGSVLIPVAAVALVCCCAAAIVGSLTGLALGNVWSTIGQSFVQ